MLLEPEVAFFILRPTFSYTSDKVLDVVLIPSSLTPELYSLFWKLDLSDLYVPIELYKDCLLKLKEENDLGQRIDSLEVEFDSQLENALSVSDRIFNDAAVWFREGILIFIFFIRFISRNECVDNASILYLSEVYLFGTRCSFLCQVFKAN